MGWPIYSSAQRQTHTHARTHAHILINVLQYFLRSFKCCRMLKVDTDSCNTGFYPAQMLETSLLCCNYFVDINIIIILITLSISFLFYGIVKLNLNTNKNQIIEAYKLPLWICDSDESRTVFFFPLNIATLFSHKNSIFNINHIFINILWAPVYEC